MRYSDYGTPEGIASELQRRLAITKSTTRRMKHLRAAENALAALAGVSLAEPNLDDDALNHAIPLDVLEAGRHSGHDGDEFDDRDKPILHSFTDNANPADYDYDKPREFLLPVERMGYCWVQPPGMREKRREPIKLRKVSLTPPSYLGMVSVETGYSVPVVESQSGSDPVAAAAAWHDAGQLDRGIVRHGRLFELTPLPTAMLTGTVDPLQYTPAVNAAKVPCYRHAAEKLNAMVAAVATPQSVVVHPDDLLLGDNLPVGSARRIAGVLYLRHTADQCEVIFTR